MRTSLLAATMSLGLLAAPAVGAPKAHCFQVKDAAGDARPASHVTPAVVQADSLDLLSADIATGAKNLVATIRLKTLAGEPYLVGGATYIFAFTLGGAAQEVYFKRSASGLESAAYMPAPASAPIAVPFVKDPGAATITWVVPRKTIVGLKTRGATISELKIHAMLGTNFNDVGSGRGGSGIDSAVGLRPYKDGTPTCLKGT